MTGTRVITGSILVAATVLLGGWLAWQSVAPVTPVQVEPLAPLAMLSDEMTTSSGFVVLSAIKDDPAAKFELPVKRPEQAEIGKLNLFQ